jgi:RNA polymerase sigma-70 factor (ECF subfamily)
MVNPSIVLDAGDDGDGGEALRTLLVRIAGGGVAAKHAASRLYEIYAPRFRAYLGVQRLAPEHIEEVVHEVFMRLLAATGRLRKVRDPDKYIWQMLRNAFADHLRQMKRRREHIAEPPAAVHDGPGETELLDWLDLLPAEGTGPEEAAHRLCLAQVLELFAREEPERAMAVFLASIEGLDGHELAEVLGRTYGAAREYLSQARKVLRTRADKTCGGFHG